MPWKGVLKRKLTPLLITSYHFWLLHNLYLRSRHHLSPPPKWCKDKPITYWQTIGIDGDKHSTKNWMHDTCCFRHFSTNYFQTFEMKYQSISSNQAAASMTNATRCVPRKAGYKRWASCLAPPETRMPGRCVFLDVLYLLSCNTTFLDVLYTFFIPLDVATESWVFVSIIVTLVFVCGNQFHSCFSMKSTCYGFEGALEKWPPRSVARNIPTNFSRIS